MKKVLLSLILSMVMAVQGQVTDIYVPIIYTGNGSTVAFAFVFPIVETSDIVVTLRTTATGAITTLAETTEYSVSATNNDFSEGGTVTTVATYASTQTVTISRDVPDTQVADFEDSGVLRLSDINAALDRATLQIQQLQDQANRSPHGPLSDTVSLDMEYPNSVDRANKSLTFDETGAATATAAATTSVAFSAFGESLVDDADADAAIDTLGSFTSSLEVGDIITKSPWFDVRAFGAVGDGSNDDTAEIQAAIDAAIAVNGTVFLPHGTYKISDSLNFYDPVRFVGEGKSTGKFNPDIAGVIIEWAGDNATDAIVIGATTSSSTNIGGNFVVQGVTLENFLLQPTVSGDGRDGILIDASIDTVANRFHARDIVLKDVDVLDFGRYNCQLRGLVFTASFWRCGFKDSADHGTTPFITEDATNVASGGINRVSQIWLYDCLLNGSSDETKWAADVTHTNFYGGTITGAGGVKLASNCGIWGTNIESSNSADPTGGSVGIFIEKAGHHIYPQGIIHYDTGIEVGDGGATQVRNVFGFVPFINDCTLGVDVTAGGLREGFLKVGQFISCVTDITNSRDENEWITDIVGRNYEGQIPFTVYDQKTLDNTGTPSVDDNTVVFTGGTTTITDFDDGVTGQSILVWALHTVEIDDGANISLQAEQDWVMETGDTLTLQMRSNGIWWENARSYNTSSGGLGVDVLSITTLDVQSAAQTTLFTVPAGKRCIIDHVKIVNGSVASTTAVISFGQNGAATDFLGNQTMTNLAAQFDTVICEPIPNATPVKTKSYAGTTVIEADVTTADVDGCTDCQVFLYGNLYD